MTRKQRRLLLIGLAGIVLMTAVGLTLFALSSRIVFFNSPTEVIAQKLAPGTRIRLGGLVVDGTIVKKPGGNVIFAVTDGNATIAVSYTGLLPDLFREGQGVVTEGVVGIDGFVADTVLAKHDERYMPPEVVEALKKQGVWQETTATAKPLAAKPETALAK
jgi:cytochrome c-type biogenesis protein CcmE